MIDKKRTAPFVKSFKEMMLVMGGIEINNSGDVYDFDGDLKSYGISASVSFAGNFKGRILLDMEKNVALKISEHITGEKYEDIKDRMVLACLTEILNTIGGDALTLLNDELKAGLRLAPPIIFTGENVIISIPKIPSVTLDSHCEYGKILFNVAVEGDK
jgi:chemotaxis protein CheX